MTKHHFYNTKIFDLEESQSISFRSLSTGQDKFISGVGNCKYLGVENIQTNVFWNQETHKNNILVSFTTVYEQQY